SANMKFAITAHGVAHPALRSRKRRWVQDNQIVLRLHFVGASEKLKNILLNPLHSQLIAFRIFSRGLKAFCVCLDASHLTRTSARTRKRKRALTRKTIEHAPTARILRNNSVIVLLIEIKPGLLSVQKIDIKLYIVDIDLDFGRRRAAQNSSARFESFHLPSGCVIALDNIFCFKKIDDRLGD